MNVTVVGSGIVGCAVAYELTSRGATVRLIDMRGTGLGATQASAGMLAPYFEGHDDALLQLGVASLSLYDPFIARVVADAGRSIEYHRTGTLHVARATEEENELEAFARRFSSADVENVLMTGAEARRIEPALSTGVRRALLIPAHGYVRAWELASALSSAAQNLHARLITGVVERIRSSASSVVATMASGDLESDAVVVACGSWTNNLLPPETDAHPPTGPVRPVRGQLLHLRLPRPVLSRVVWGTGCYLVPWNDGSLLVGATVEEAGFDETATVAGVTELLASSSELVAAIRSARFEAVRVGLRPATPDELPLIGASSTMRGVYYATGHYRNGVLLAPLTAKLIADLVIDGRQAPELALVRPERFGL